MTGCRLGAVLLGGWLQCGLTPLNDGAEQCRRSKVQVGQGAGGARCRWSKVQVEQGAGGARYHCMKVRSSAYEAGRSGMQVQQGAGEAKGAMACS